MPGLQILILLIFASSVPAIAVYLWFRIARYSFSTAWFLLSVLIGAAAFFPALVLQHLIPQNFAGADRWGLAGQIFIRVALSEELARLIMLFIFFYITQKIDAQKQMNGQIPAGEKVVAAPPIAALPPAPDLSFTELVRYSAAGLVAGLGFSLLENAVYGASDTSLVLLRIFTAAPLHAACGARVGSAAALFRTRPVQGLVRFITAVAIHGFYNFMIIIPGIPSIAAILIALSAAASSVISIHGGMKGENN
jgi:RsiW-degrading membrane proteinase PrsW (M82 family)